MNTQPHQTSLSAQVVASPAIMTVFAQLRAAGLRVELQALSNAIAPKPAQTHHVEVFNVTP